MKIVDETPLAATRWQGTGLALALLVAACGDEVSTPELASESHASIATATTPSMPAPARSAPTTGTITLITGDRVTLQPGPGAPVPLIVPGPGRQHVVFSTREHDGEVTVIPRDVAALIASGQLDPALFDVSRLIADGFGDDRRHDVPLVVTGDGGAAFAGQRMAGITVDRTLPALRMVAMRQDKASPGAALASLARGPSLRATLGSTPGSTKIWLDRRLALALDHSVAQIGGPAAHARGITGQGVTVAVLDTGIDDTHPDLAGKVAVARAFTEDGRDATDLIGHGTHVASIIAGTGAASNGQFRGVAPDATLISGRVCEDRSCSISAIIAGMEWAVVEQHARIINISIGGQDTPELDPMELAINQLSAEHGALFVVAAGNSGSAPGTVETPGSADAALTVAAVDRDDGSSFFSSRGPRVGDSGLKPEIAAPGVGIVAARAAGTALGNPVSDDYTQASGTSMATPHVAGAAALLLQQHPDWRGARLKTVLLGAANPNPALSAFEQGAGRVDVDRATQPTVFAEPAVISLGAALWPHADDPRLVRTVRYDNPGAEPIALSLAATITGPGGPAPAGFIAVSPAQLTVPAGGSAEAVVTVDTARESPDGLYGGALTATGPGVRVVTPLGVDREAEVYNLTLRLLDHAGNPTIGDAFWIAIAPSRIFGPDFLIDGQITLRLPAATYELVAFEGLATLIAPRIRLARDTELTLDGRLARPFEVGVAQRDLVPFDQTLSFSDRVAGFSMGIGGPVELASAELGDSAPPGEISSQIQVSKIPAADAGTFEPHDIYYFVHEQLDHFLTGWTAQVRPRDLATVHARHVGDDSMTKFVIGMKAAGGGGVGVSYPGAFSRTERYYGPGFQWRNELQAGFDFLDQLRAYPAGRSFDESWNQAPFGPAFAGGELNDRADRLGTPIRDADLLIVRPSMFSDQGTPARSSPSFLVNGRARLLRNGEVIAQADGFVGQFVELTVPPEPSLYRLEIDVTRFAELSPLSTTVSAAWTFRSQHVDGVATLPLPTVRFAPKLDEHNQSDARVLAMPIHIERAPGAPMPRIAHARVDVSFDDGASWTRAPLLLLGDDAIALVVHRAGASHVSLRGATTDAAGNASEVTIIRAYALAP